MRGDNKLKEVANVAGRMEDPLCMVELPILLVATRTLLVRGIQHLDTEDGCL